MFIEQLLLKLANHTKTKSSGLSHFSLVPLVVGIDPQLSLIHPSLFTDGFSEIAFLGDASNNHKSSKSPSELLELVAKLYLRYAQVVIDAVHDLVPAIKIQVAFFEPYGQYGIAALAQVMQYAKDKELLVIADAKRGDISSTAEAYAQTFLGNQHTSLTITGSVKSPLVSDALTVNPYMGEDSLLPFFLRARNKGKGLFVLLKTSNPGSVDIQDQELKNGSKVYELVINIINKEIQTRHSYSQNGYLNIGVVVGATFTEEAKRIRKLLPYSYFLVPGLGFQQGDFSELRNYLNPDGRGALF